MSITTEYYKTFSVVELTGRLSAQQIMGNMIEYGRSDKFRSIQIRVIDARKLQHVLFSEKEMKALIAVDKASFLENDSITVIIISNDLRFIPLFETYINSMSATPWQFHIVADLDEAKAVALQQNIDLTW